MKAIEDILSRQPVRWEARDGDFFPDDPISDLEVANAIRDVPPHYATTGPVNVVATGFVNPTAVTLNMGAQPNNLDNLALVEVSGTFTGVTAAFRGSAGNDSSGNPIWANIAAIRQDTQALETTPTVSNSTNRIWALNVAGFNQVQMNFTALSTGTVVVNISTSNQDNPSVLGLSLQSALSGAQTISGALTQSGGTASINASSNNNTVINTGTSTGTVGIGNTLAGALTIQSGAASTLQVTGGNLTVGTLTSGSLLLTSAGVITGTAVGNSSLTVTSGSLTLQTLTSGAIVINSVGALTVTSATASTWAATGGLTFSAGFVNLGTAASVAYAATMALVVASNTVTIAASNGTAAAFTVNCAAVAPAGATLIIITTADGTGTVTGTFGTHFKVTGTQATTLSKFSTIMFVGDGTNWIEIARNTNQT